MLYHSLAIYEIQNLPSMIQNRMGKAINLSSFELYFDEKNPSQSISRFFDDDDTEVAQTSQLKSSFIKTIL